VILGIDAFNIRTGGGITHLVELLGAAEPLAYGFHRVIIWSSTRTLERIGDRDWLTKVSDPLLNQELPYRMYWNRFRQRKLANQTNCNVVFSPGGSNESGFVPNITMSRNLLPFEWRELRRYGWDLLTLKLLFLRWTQCRTLRKANGVIFLTEYARNAVTKVTGELRGECQIIPHGINPRFVRPPRAQDPFIDFTESRPCRVLYVSVVNVYKHQWHVAEAVAMLRDEGVPIVLELVGPPAKGMNQLMRAIEQFNPSETFIKYHGAVPYENLDAIYASADVFAFASSCENMPNILLEGMAAGLPIACSRKGPMPEVLGDAGVYFDPEKALCIARALRELIRSHELRARLAQAAFERAQSFSWKRCADDTFRFLARVAREAHSDPMS
jgi:glycosyltransferase involved in cell wall biosynthesis